MNLALPNKWELCTFDDVCTPTEQVIPKEDTEFFYIDISSVDRISKKIISPQRIIGKDAPSRARKLIKTGDVIVSMTRPNLNAVALVGSEYDGQIASTGFEILRSNGVDPRWIGYLVRTNEFIDAMTSLVQGALYPAIRSKDVRAHQIPVAPLAEQRRIADKLDTTLARVDALNDRLARIIPLLKRFRQSVLAAATSGRLTEDISNLFGKEKNNFWELKSVDSIADVIDPHPSHRTPPEVLGGVPYVSIGDIDEQGNIDFEKSRKVSPVVLEEHKSRYLIENGDFIFGKIGTIGKPTKIPINIEYTISANVILIKPKKELVNPDYLRYFFSSMNFLEDIAKKSVATSQAAFGIKKMRSLQIKIPTLEEQTEIVRRVEILFAFADRLEARLQSAQTAAERLTPALLAKAFRGELVPQDPNDEPATELLRRLRAARAADTASKPKRGRAAKAPTVSE